MRTEPSKARILARARPTRAALAALALLALAAPALGMQDVATPPQPDRGMGVVSPILGYGLMAIAAAGMVLVNLMPAKRGHQD